MKNNKFLTMAFESSCDETAIAILADGREVLSNVISSQIDIFKNYGGVVPEIAARHHLENINEVVDEALKKADVTMEDIDLIAVTEGPGLVGALLIGVATAKAVAFACDKPIIGVHHIMGHVAANYIEFPQLEPPFTALIASGGHTNIAEVKNYTEVEIIGGTRDDAIGEAYDKVARVLGLGYPGGPKIDKIAKEGNPDAIHFKRVFLEKDSMDFSFSGLKTAVLNHLNIAKQKGEEINRADVAASFQQAVMDVVTEKAVQAAKEMGHGKLVLAGGVASNSALRAILKKKCDEEQIKLYVPSPILCTDNGAMIGCAGYYKYKEGQRSGLDMDAHANMPLSKAK
ncbi:MAG: tRNA (adenosine(37)-N6)-threonylcarbamoyltransferase complex transferase subunit TsaD [Firmicutes bacterium]|nr:tRNA (adenosine(37)-N6)-threonylcarbamoyltransferase complex transferase subunit TsaD [Bacillota bacterium]